MRQVGGFACRYHVMYTRGVIEKGEGRGKLAELQIDKVAAQKEISKKQLEEEGIPGGIESRNKE